MSGKFFRLHPRKGAPVFGLAAVALAMLLAPLSAAAQPKTPVPVRARLGNLPPGFYPAPPCKKPAPEKEAEEPRGMADARFAQIGQDNIAGRAERFNTAVTAYNQCAKTYIQQSQQDIERIVRAVNAAITDVRETAPPTQVGNLPADFYPRSPCVKPDQTRLGVQPAAGDAAAITAYNLEAETFNQQAAAFNSCREDYRGKAQHDIQEIRAAAQPAAAGDNIGPIPTPRVPGLQR